ncbi:peptide methionine sulfoxide reductase [Clostridium perfringens]|uniref:peptide methionine sulfoxide reductase n=2 Tax=Clostridium perfringens TaxID=1502 RepID=UPI000DA2B820|nr:peptide methionine sulfoxide reductase [Clostridium perfringens]ELC8435091.1 peptide methionine sulfoxide reductase [Clostridium perfringens]MDK0574315.1 peptide methionine sulfoxide reductase [Clostridium perfringens]MDK0718765.1 peptide methionine sulfoxide reductase [Clostridium perfringens]MDK0890342.1 peptide methionine sulfoxide reductase [Clostridium perfringens]MDM0481031.1 peptide methionine sulfoxide reductase [Clostridium perfringens]
MNFEELTDFLMYLIDKQREEDLWQIWVHKDIDKDFIEFKKEVEESNKKQRMSKKQEKENIEKAERILKG